jgi:hypothetical protein
LIHYAQGYSIPSDHLFDSSKTTGALVDISDMVKIGNQLIGGKLDKNVSLVAAPSTPSNGIVPIQSHFPPDIQTKTPEQPEKPKPKAKKPKTQPDPTATVSTDEKSKGPEPEMQPANPLNDQTYSSFLHANTKTLRNEKATVE